MGRYRGLPELSSPTKNFVKHAERAAINTPLQGGAADIVSKAMILVHRDQLLKKLGWSMILQIHDELILEGPAESSSEALVVRGSFG